MTEENTKKNIGAFQASLLRNNKKIRGDRAQSIVEDTQIVYQRKVQDLEISINKMRRERENMLDLSPSTADSLVLASDFDSGEYVEKDLDLGLKIRNTEIRLEIAKTQYQSLFEGDES